MRNAFTMTPPRGRLLEIACARRIRFADDPYSGRYTTRRYDNCGRLAGCKIDPYSGAFIGISLRL